MASHAEFGETTPADEIADAFGQNIKGKNVLITGVGPNSLGEAMAVALAAHEPNLLILASRSADKLSRVSATLKEKAPKAPVKVVILDLMSQKSVRAAAADVAATVDHIDVFVNNAGIIGQQRLWTEEKIEGQFGTNHVGPFLFTNLLMPQIRAAAKKNAPGETRIVNITSHGHRLSPIRFSDYNLEKEDVPEDEMHPRQLPPAFLKKIDGYLGFIAYGQSKTANLLFTVYLREHLKEEGILAYAVHPGSIWTGLTRDLDPEGNEAFGKTSNFWKTPEQGSSTILVAGFDPKLNNPPGLYFDNCQVAEKIPAVEHATDPKIAERLWHLSEQLVGQEFKL